MENALITAVSGLFGGLLGLVTMLGVAKLWPAVVAVSSKWFKGAIFG